MWPIICAVDSLSQIFLIFSPLKSLGSETNLYHCCKKQSYLFFSGHKPLPAYFFFYIKKLYYFNWKDL